ncbi:MAG: hypothetical protein SOI66_03270 [Bifidobacterium sp.]|jgi:hypothetical protein
MKDYLDILVSSVQHVLAQSWLIPLAVAIGMLFAAFIVWRFPTWRLRRKFANFADVAGYTKAKSTTNFSGKPVTKYVRPRIARRKRTPFGYQFRLRLMNDLSIEKLERDKSALAAHLKLWKIEIKEYKKPGYALVLAYRKHSQAPKSYSSHELWKEQHA